MYICIYIYIYIHVCIYVLLPLLDLLSFTAGNEAPLSVGKAAQHIVHHHEQFSTTGRDCSSLVGLYLSLLPYLLLPKEICPLSKGKGPVADILIRCLCALQFASSARLAGIGATWDCFVPHSCNCCAQLYKAQEEKTRLTSRNWQLELCQRFLHDAPKPDGASIAEDAASHGLSEGWAEAAGPAAAGQGGGRGGYWQLAPGVRLRLLQQLCYAVLNTYIFRQAFRARKLPWWF